VVGIGARVCASLLWLAIIRGLASVVSRELYLVVGVLSFSCACVLRSELYQLSSLNHSDKCHLKLRRMSHTYIPEKSV